MLKIIKWFSKSFANEHFYDIRGKRFLMQQQRINKTNTIGITF